MGGIELQDEREGKSFCSVFISMILLNLNEELYENDLRALLMAFYPGNSMIRQKKEDVQVDISLTVQYNRELSNVYMTLETERGVITKQAKVLFTEKKQGKIDTKTLLYKICSEDTKRELPWGTLTGIRPTKIAMTMLGEGKTEQEIQDYMRNIMLCGKEKTELSLDIAKREQSILKTFDYKNGYSLYIGIPFCPTTCAYCSFTSYPISKWKEDVDEYLTHVEMELDYIAKQFQNRPLHTVYFGGGTPTTLEPYQLDRILKKVEQTFDLSHCIEFCVEAGRPDSITREKLETLKNHAVTRISINPQTMKEETLKLIGRRHTVEQVKEAYRLAREVGFTNINMDMILGLPDETEEDIHSTLEQLKQLAPDNLTVHSLAIKRAARLNIQKESFADTKSINSEAIIEMTADYASQMGMKPYYLYRQKNMTGNMENVGYAVPGKEGIYNILIMEELQTIVGAGAGATTKAVFGDRIERAENVKDVATYIQKTEDMIARKQKLFKN